MSVAQPPEDGAGGELGAAPGGHAELLQHQPRLLRPHRVGSGAGSGGARGGGRPPGRNRPRSGWGARWRISPTGERTRLCGRCLTCTPTTHASGACTPGRRRPRRCWPSCLVSRGCVQRENEIVSMTTLNSGNLNDLSFWLLHHNLSPSLLSSGCVGGPVHLPTSCAFADLFAEKKIKRKCQKNLAGFGFTVCVHTHTQWLLTASTRSNYQPGCYKPGPVSSGTAEILLTQKLNQWCLMTLHWCRW